MDNQQKPLISNFLKCLTEKDYSNAKKSLQAVMDIKLQNRIQNTVKELKK
jgi:hypothetical protein